MSQVLLPASGALTAMGGRTAHASLIARQMGKACVVSCAGLVVDAAAHRAEIGGVPLVEGDWISVDGDTGEVFLGQIEIATERPEAMLAEVETWREDAAKHQAARRSAWRSESCQSLSLRHRPVAQRVENRLDCDNNM